MGNISKAQEILNDMRIYADSKNDKDGLPDIDSYTALMNALIDQQNHIISTIEHGEIGNQSSPSESESGGGSIDSHSSMTNKQKAVKIMALAEIAHDLLIQMEDSSGVSDHYSSMRLSGFIESNVRNKSLRPTSHHYDSVISAFANATTAAHTTHYASHLAKNAPYIAQRWLQRMETLAFDPHSGVTPTVESYHRVMEACAASGSSSGTPFSTASFSNKQSKAAVLTQAIFDKLKENTNVRPTAREYKLLLRTWCGSSCKDAAFKATGLWMTMQKSLRWGIEEMEPSLDDGKMVLKAWSKAM